MKKVDAESDELRPEYRREDFGPMVRGKYAERMRELSNVVVLDPDVVEAFPQCTSRQSSLARLLEHRQEQCSFPFVGNPGSEH